MTDKETTYPVELLPPAQYELEEIARLHRQLSGSVSARKTTDGIYDALGQLSRFPFSGAPIRDEELRTIGYRYVVEKNYLVIYRQIDGTVYIYHIVHGKTNYPTLFRTNYFQNKGE